jgi:hypothetical protein
LIFDFADFALMFYQYVNPIDFINSTAAARVNGYVGGYGAPQAE